MTYCLVICAGAVFAAKTVGLQLDPAIVTREVGFYALSILLLYLALQDKRPDPEDDESDVDHLYISFGDACYLLGGYMAYVAVCAKMDDIVAVCSTFRGIRNSDSQKELRKNKYGDAAERPSVRRVSLPHADDQKRYFLREQSLMTHEPVANFEPVAFYRTLTGDVNPDGMDATTCALSGYQIMDPNITSSVRSNFSDSGRSNTPRSPPMTESATQALSSVVSEGSAGTDFMNRCHDGLSLGNIEFMMHKSKPSDVHDMYDIELNVVRHPTCILIVVPVL